ncbi:hypothetical protein P3H15_52685 [Rhodococcus sp. T2V]|nr:hypothetical protein [Rhodococcus sp. T2V]MDF3313555.1 hypothetical protein [Rhodococcus sp. T2V]
MTPLPMIVCQQQRENDVKRSLRQPELIHPHEVPSAEGLLNLAEQGAHESAWAFAT